MKVKFWCNSSVNIHSCKTETVDLNDWDISAEDWNEMTDDEKREMVVYWARENGLDIGYKEISE